MFGAYAQEQDTKIVEEFNPHWYVGAQFGAQYTLGELDFGDLISPNAQIIGGYNFTELWGVRFGVNAWQSKGGQTLEGTDYKWKWNYVSPRVDVTFNLSNLIAGFNPHRVVNVGIFAGIGGNFAFNNDEAADAKQALAYNSITGNQPLAYYWNDNKAFFQGQFGANVDFRVSDHWAVTLEAQANVLNDHYNSKKAGNADWYFNGLAGVKYNFGKTYRSKEVPVERCIPTERIVEKVVEKVVEKPVPVAAQQEEIRRDIFFVISGTKISDAENVKLLEVVDFLKKNPNAKVEVTGYADRGTGHSEINNSLSERRAAAVVEALKKQGIDASRITSSSKGDTEQPFEVNELNRVSICVAK
jgi:outer membrane protein OmpA-like peptidoglycan-associated protein